jgi:hypothetical protein
MLQIEFFGEGGKTRGKTRQNPYPRHEGTGFVRVQIWLPGPVPRCTLPVTPAGFRTRGIPYLTLKTCRVLSPPAAAAFAPPFS